jgi:hypothetical protein
MAFSALLANKRLRLDCVLCAVLFVVTLVMVALGWVHHNQGLFVGAVATAIVTLGMMLSTSLTWTALLHAKGK